MSRVMRPALALTVIVAVATVVTIGLRSIGSPTEARRLRLDEQRLSDLQKVGGAVDAYWRRTKKLPADSRALVSGTDYELSIRDRERDVEYGYRTIDDTEYELCADFERTGGVGSWAHGAGRACFTRDARPVDRP